MLIRVKLILKLAFPILLIAGSTTVAHAVSSSASTPTPFAKRTDVQAFIKEMGQKHGFTKEYLSDLFQAFGTEPKILALMDKQYEALPWYKYRDHIVSKIRVKEGVQFFKQNKKVLKKAEKEFGVPAEIIVAIIGIESKYGQMKGKYPVLQSLSTLAFDYPRRANFFKGELEHFLLLTREENFNPKEILGSFAGAMGMPQFMPSSYRRFAVDFSGTGQRDLMNNTPDVIGSIANYFKKHGWKPKETVISKAIVQGTRHKTLTQSKEMKPTLSLRELAQYSVKPANPKSFKNKAAKLKLIALEKSKGNFDHWIVHDNFYVITRYNHSVHYAMAVTVLSERIRASL